jgi:ABC-type branched-subunit amino acid transport system substrate-binding protein
MRARSIRLVAAATVLAAVAAACSTSSSPSSSRSSSTTAGGSNGSATTTGKLTASYKGVTATEIKVGFTYPDLETLAKTGLIKADNGPYADMAKALIDDINAHGGINGRKLVLYSDKYSVLGSTEQLAVCTKQTEDDGVFVILGGFISDNNRCAIQQHQTMVIYAYGAGFNQIMLSAAKAPFLTYLASDERGTTALVQILAAQGSLKGKTIGVYGTPTSAKPLIDITVNALKSAGYTVKDTAVNDVVATDQTAFNAQDKVIGQRFKDEHIDTVFVQGTVPPGSNWDAVGYHPAMYSPQTSLITSGAFTNGYNKFPVVAGLAASSDPNLGYNTPAFQHCRDVYKAATGKTILTYTQEQSLGKSTGFAGMSSTCSVVQMFVQAATKAGADLTYDSFVNALESLGKIAIAASPVASFAPNKPDGQDSFQLMKMNPAWKPGSTGIQQLLPVGSPITLTS